MGKIQILQDNIINLIAAGEVVERPASIIKELLENSVDAGATQIVVKVSHGGLDMIQLSDNGTGMDKQDAMLAFKQHATSKISSQTDLENIRTLGFRGEALASISSVAKIEVDTKTASDDPVKLNVYKDVFTFSPSAKAEPGTTISVRDLFLDVPARRKFLRTEATEFTYIQNTFLSVALVNLNIHFELYHNDKLIYRLPAAQRFTDRIYDIWDSKLAENLFSNELEQNGIKLQLHVGSPDVARGDRKLQYLFVNGRSVSDRLLQKAVTEAFQGFLHRDLQPVFFVMLDIPAEMVDVNVHPRKQEVRFRDSGSIFNLVRTAVQQQLGHSTKAELLNRIHSQPESASFPTPAGNSMHFSDSFRQPSYSAPRQQTERSMDFTSALRGSSDFAPATEATSLDESVTGNYLQIFATYIVYQQDEQIVFVDQHAAAEKILYEKLTQQLDLNRSKPMLVPEIVELDKPSKAKILELKDQLGHTGFQVEDFGGNSVQVTGIPEVIPQMNIGRFLQELAQTTEDSENLPLRNDIKHYLVATMACHGAIRAGQPLSQIEMRQLISDLSRCNSPYNCPHGRPVSWTMSRYELEKGFKRII